MNVRPNPAVVTVRGYRFPAQAPSPHNSVTSACSLPVYDEVLMQPSFKRASSSVVVAGDRSEADPVGGKRCFIASDATCSAASLAFVSVDQVVVRSERWRSERFEG